MNTTIILAHPYHGSFNKAIFDCVKDKEIELGNDCQIIDLNKDKFNPVLEEHDLAVYNKGLSNDILVNKYIKILDKTDKIIIIFPIWWYDMPAILRGFFDKVMLNGSAFTEKADGLHPIRDIKKTFVITTSAATTNDLIHEFGDPINGVIINATFSKIGFNNAVWYNVEEIINKSNEELRQHLSNIQEIL